MRLIWPPDRKKVRSSQPGISRRQLGAAVLGSVVVTATGFYAAGRIKSPAQAAADSTAPPPSILTERIEKRVLTATVVVRGTVSAEQSVAVVAKGAAATPVVTAIPVKYGDLVDAATVLVEIAGRPVFALPGKVPSYRDLRPSINGDDVAQLQTALKSLGYSIGDKSGYYGWSTKTAVRKFYQSKGYEPLPASESDEQLIEQAENSLTMAERALRDAKTALKEAQASGLGVTAAEQAVADRTEDLDKAKDALATVRGKTGPMMPTAEVVYLKGFPARIDAVAATVGTLAEGLLLTVSAGKLVVRTELAPFQKDLVQPGQSVQILSELTGLSAEATVTSVADNPTSDGDAAAPGAGVTYAMTADSATPLDASLAGQDVRVSITSATSGNPVLVVPFAAVSAASDGNTIVTVLVDEEPRRVAVVVGMVGDGYVQVTPLAGQTLEPGQLVVLGR